MISDIKYAIALDRMHRDRDEGEMIPRIEAFIVEGGDLTSEKGAKLLEKARSLDLKPVADFILAQQASNVAKNVLVVRAQERDEHYPGKSAHFYYRPQQDQYGPYYTHRFMSETEGAFIRHVSLGFEKNGEGRSLYIESDHPEKLGEFLKEKQFFLRGQFCTGSYTKYPKSLDEIRAGNFELRSIPYASFYVTNTELAKRLTRFLFDNNSFPGDVFEANGAPKAIRAPSKQAAADEVD